jgi:hypothetical protein
MARHEDWWPDGVLDAFDLDPEVVARLVDDGGPVLEQHGYSRQERHR